MPALRGLVRRVAWLCIAVFATAACTAAGTGQPASIDPSPAASASSADAPLARAAVSSPEPSATPPPERAASRITGTGDATVTPTPEAAQAPRATATPTLAPSPAVRASPAVVTLPASFPGDPRACIAGAIGAEAMSAIESGRRAPTQEEQSRMVPCFAAGGMSPGGTGGGQQPPSSQQPPQQQAGQGGSPGRVPLRNAPPGYFSYSDACPALEDMLHNLQHFRPSWQQLQCHAAKLNRLPAPAYTTRILLSGEAFPASDNSVPALLAAIDVAYDSGANISSFPPTFMPPYIDSQRRPLQHPLDADAFDEKLRAISVVAVREKMKGRLNDFGDMWPDTQFPYGIPSSEEAFKAWVREVFLPQKVLQAQVAEWLKAEYYDPFPKEPEVMVFHTRAANGGPLSDHDAVRLAQWLIDETRNAVRPHFAGVLYLTSAPRYDLVPEWEQLSYRGWDRVAFTLITECDIASTKRQAELHVRTFAKVAERDGVKWGLGELDIHKHRYDLCGQEWSAVEVPAYQYVFGLLDSTTPAPAMLAIGAHWPVDPTGKTAVQGLTDSGRSAIREYFKGR